MKYFSTFSGIGGFEKSIQEIHPDWECVGFSEIDRFAIQCYSVHFSTHKNYGDIDRIDILNLPDFDLLVGGSPCQDLSVAKKDRQGLQGEKSKLFFKWLEILKIKKPKYFILENVNSMSKENKAIITKYISEVRGDFKDYSPIMIDAALVSAQSRKRLFWCNFPVPQPQDRKIFLKDILEPIVDEKYFIRNKTVLDKLTYLKGKKKKENGFQEGNIRFPQTESEKAFPILTGENSISRTSNYIQLDNSGKEQGQQQDRFYDIDGKLRVTPYPNQHNIIVPQAQRVYDSDRAKSVTLSSSGGGLGARTGLYQIGFIGENNVQGYRVYSEEGKSQQLTGSSGGINSGEKTGLYAVEVSNQGTEVGKEIDKSITLMARDFKGFGNQPMTPVIGCAFRTRSYANQEGKIEERDDGKANSLTSLNKDSMVKSISAVGDRDNRRIGTSDKAYCLSANADSDSTPRCIGNFGIRKLTPVECARLQCFPDSWANMLSNSRAYKAYGNAVNVEVIKHIVRQIPND